MGELYLCSVDAGYLKYLHKVDNRVSVKFNNRPFVGVITIIDDKHYLIPLTSQTTEERKKKGKTKRSSRITTFIRDAKDEEIADILYNNMIPVTERDYTIIDIDPELDTYESNEIRFIRKHSEQIINKARKIYRTRLEGEDNFLNVFCCDFTVLEEACEKFDRSNN